jgi:hypothetical protein
MKGTISGFVIALCAGLAVPALADQPSPGEGAGKNQNSNTQQDSPAKPGEKGEAQAGRDEKNPGMAMARAADLSRNALTHIQAGIQALNAHDDKAAQQALDQAAGTLRTLYMAVPAGPVLSELGPNEPGKPMDVAPLLAEVQSRSVWMDPDVVAKVDKANKQAKSGEKEAATQSLLEARQRLTADVALLPIEDAYSRVQAARGELRDGHAESALRLLRNVPVAIEHVQATAPLVPVRFNLRAAAAAAEKGSWQEAEALVEQARKDLEALASNSAAPAELHKELKPVVKQAQKIDQRFDQGKRPAPKELRELAQQTRSLANTAL